MRRFGKFILILPLIMVSLNASYSIKPGKRPRSALDHMHFHTLLDMKRVPQNMKYYAKQIQPIPYSKQLAYAKDYINKFFEPWRRDGMHEPQNDLTWQVRFVQKRTIYDAHKKIIPPKVWRWWIRNSDLEHIDTIKGRAISIRHTNLRAFPTDTPAYKDPWKSTEGFPFDYNQNSELHPNVPLYISHYSKDHRWAFVHAGHAFGWVKLKDIAIVNTKFIKLFQSGHYYITIRDNLYIYHNNKPYSIVKMATLFPKSRYTRSLLLATRDAEGNAKIDKIPLPKKSLVSTFPAKFNAHNVAYIAQQFRGEPYGWGGKLYGRDCSSTTRDFLGCFGIFLNRNSEDQSKEGKRTKIKGLAKAQKKQAIIKYAKPFRSLLYVPGHIGLYLGHYKNEPIIMHTYWGIRLNNWSKYTLSRTIVSTTELGKEHPQIREKSKLINTLKYIINF